MSLHEGMDTRRVTSSDCEKGMDMSWTRPVAMNPQHCHVGGQKVCAALLLQRTSLVRNVGQCAQLSNCQCYVITGRSSIATIVLQLLSFKILSLRAESWLFARQTSDLLDEELFSIRSRKWLPSLLAC